MPERFTEARIDDAFPIFSALGDPTRLRLVVQLSRVGPQSIKGLCKSSEVSRQAVSKHLGVLADAGLVRGERRGREHIWELQAKRIDQARSHLDRIDAQWDAAIDRLRKHVGDDD